MRLSIGLIKYSTGIEITAIEDHVTSQTWNLIWVLNSQFWELAYIQNLMCLLTEPCQLTAIGD
jgi:hypothetical protein